MGAKQRNVPTERQGDSGVGDVRAWTAICSDTKLVPSFCVGTRDSDTAYIFMHDLASRLRERGHLTTDGYKACPLSDV